MSSITFRYVPPPSLQMSWKRKANQPNRLADHKIETTTNNNNREPVSKELSELPLTEFPKSSNSEPSPSTPMEFAAASSSSSSALHFLSPPSMSSGGGGGGCPLNLSPNKSSRCHTQTVTTKIPAGCCREYPSAREAASADIMTILRGACLSSGLSRDDKMALLAEITSQISGLKRQLGAPNATYNSPKVGLKPVDDWFTQIYYSNLGDMRRDIKPFCLQLGVCHSV